MNDDRWRLPASNGLCRLKRVRTDFPSGRPVRKPIILKYVPEVFSHVIDEAH